MDRPTDILVGFGLAFHPAEPQSWLDLRWIVCKNVGDVGLVSSLVRIRHYNAAQKIAAMLLNFPGSIVAPSLLIAFIFIPIQFLQN